LALFARFYPVEGLITDHWINMATAADEKPVMLVL
jgi:hypothetical protein